MTDVLEMLGVLEKLWLVDALDELEDTVEVPVIDTLEVLVTPEML